jgi:ubiquinone/menaquinone biosynthesis C-methylase UbiE
VATDHATRIQQAFTHQAPHLESAPTFRQPDVLERMRQAAGSGGVLLDVACGPGLVLEALAPGFDDIRGIDITRAMVERARRRLAAAGVAHARVDEGSAYALPFPDGAVDVVVSRLALHHLEEPDAALREMARVLRPGGRLVVVDLVASEDPAAAALHDALETLRDPSHVRLLPETALRAAIAGAGFEDVAVEAWGQLRGFAEWAAIVDDVTRAAPLRIVMEALARAGIDAGTGLRMGPDEPVFEHAWRLVAARRGET